MANNSDYELWQLQKGNCGYCKKHINLQSQYSDEFVEPLADRDRLVDFMVIDHKSSIKAINPVSGETVITNSISRIMYHKPCAHIAQLG